jgi:hypothetical protein
VAILGRPAAVVAGALAVAAAGCEPEILSGAYYCGPELACPDDQVCSAGDGTCVAPGLARPFACPDGTEASEPDDDAASAATITLATCPVAGVTRTGCLPAAPDRDWVAVIAPTSCIGRPLSIDVRFPAAFAPVVLERMLADGTTAEVAPACDITGGVGANDAVCLRTTVPADGTARVRITFDAERDCDAACDFTHYEVTVGVQ